MCASAFAAGMALCVPVHADVKYTMQTTLLGDQAKHANDFSMSMTTYVKGGNQRQDSNMSAGPMQMTSETLTLCDKQETIQVSNAAKVYTVASMRALSSLMPSMPSFGGMGGRGGGPQSPLPQSSDSGGTGTDDVTITIDDEGPDQVNNIDAHHYILNMTTASTGCAGNSTTSLKMEVWVAHLILGGVGCPGLFHGSHGAPAAAPTGGCQVTTAFHGDMAKLEDIFSHMMVKMIMYGTDGKPMMMNQITDYSSAPLDDSTFAIPPDYQQVSQTDFAKDQQHAMMQAIMGGGGQNAGNPEGDQQTQPADNGDNGANPAASTGDNGNQAPPQKHHGFSLPGGFHL
jgi:hypothetical protein